MVRGNPRQHHYVPKFLMENFTDCIPSEEVGHNSFRVKCVTPKVMKIKLHIWKLGSGLIQRHQVINESPWFRPVHILYFVWKVPMTLAFDPVAIKV